LHHFVTNSPWNERAILNRIAKEAGKLLAGKDTCLLIDETGFPKKGRTSVGVMRQYCGRTGKIDNCQMSVFAALVSGEKSLPIDFRLYLPKEWTEDRERCLKAGIPADKIEIKTKAQQAFEMVKSAKEKGIKFNWVGADAGYGKDPGFLADLWNLGVIFVADVHKSQLLYFKNPNETEEEKSVSVEQWVSERPEKSWKVVTTRQSTNGKIRLDILHEKVWIKIGHTKNYRQVRLLVRRHHDSKGEIKFCVSNAPDSISNARLAYMQGQRFWIERAFEDSKSSLGMGEYQLRKWRGWHHHMSLVLLAHLFLLRERLENAKDFPLLSCQDVVTLLAFYLPKRDITERELFRQLKLRHTKRFDSIERNRGR
jgi:SRSO17 transposase